MYFAIKDILIYGKDSINQNRQYNNELLIRFIESNEHRAVDKNAYTELRIEGLTDKTVEEDEEIKKEKENSKEIRFLGAKW